MKVLKIDNKINGQLFNSEVEINDLNLLRKQLNLEIAGSEISLF